MKSIRTRLLILAAAVATLAPGAANADTQVTIGGRDYQVTGVSTAPGTDAPLGAADAALEIVANLLQQVPGKPCAPSGSDITIGDLSGTGLADLANPGDIYYLWKVPTTVKIKGNCDKTTISTVTYSDQPVVTTSIATLANGGPYQARRDGDVTVLQAPEWLVLYYSARNLYTRALIGSFTLTVQAGYVDAKTNAEVLKFACKAKTWYFWATPQRPELTTSSEVTNC